MWATARRILTGMARRQTHDDPLIPPPGTRLKGLALGIDVGGTGVKAALVDLATGRLASDRVREKTPQPATPEAVTATVASVVAQVLDGETVPDDLPVGCGLPGVVTEGILRTAANIDKSWEGVSVEGIVGDPEPLAAIQDALNLHGFDEVVISTLPARFSRWCAGLVNAGCWQIGRSFGSS